MLTTSSKNISFSGDIKVDNNIVSDVHANYTGGNDAYFSFNISNFDLANSNKESFIADINAFIEQMFEAIIDFND